MPTDTPASAVYLAVLLQYYEEEVMGEAYFLGLAERLEGGRCRRQLALLAEVERAAAGAVSALLRKYGLQPRPAAQLADKGAAEAGHHAHLSWPDYLQFIIDTFPGYTDDFRKLEAMAPAADLPALKRLTEHEILTIEYARRALRGDDSGAAPLREYPGRTEPAGGAAAGG